MIDIPFLSDACIMDHLKQNYNIEVASITHFGEGADMNAVRYEVQTADHASYFVKLKRDYHQLDINLKLLELLHGSGIQQIIMPIKTRDGHATLRINGFYLVVYPFIEGVNGFSQKLTEQQWITVGSALRKVHDFAIPSSVLKYIRQETYSPQWRQAVCAFYASFQDELISRDDITLQFVHFMKEHKAVIQSLVERAEQLCSKIKQLEIFVLCHADLHAGNVLLHGDGTIYILDWDELIMAPKERDLMFIGGGVGNVWNDPQEEVYFYEGYGNTDINRSLLAYYRCERIVQDVAEYAHALLLAGDKEHETELYRNFVNMFDSQGVVEIAFKTVATLEL